MSSTSQKVRKKVTDLKVGDEIRIGSTLTHIERIRDDTRNNEFELTLGRVYKTQAPMILTLRKYDYITIGW